MKAENYSSALLGELLGQILPEEQKIIERKMLLAAKIDDAVKAKGWNQNQFAQVMGKYDSEISKWLSGTHNFNCETLWAISDKLGIDLLPVREIPKLVQVKYVPIVLKVSVPGINQVSMEGVGEPIAGTIMQKNKSGVFTTHSFAAKLTSALKDINPVHGDC